jgi:predicted membrane protein
VAEPKFTRSYAILRPGDEPAYPIPASQFKRYIERLRYTEKSTDFFQGLGWALMGVAVSAFFAAIAFPDEDKYAKRYIVCWAITGSALIMSIVTLAFSSLQKKGQQQFRAAVIDDMEEFARLCEGYAHTTTAQSSPKTTKSA